MVKVSKEVFYSQFVIIHMHLLIGNREYNFGAESRKAPVLVLEGAIQSAFGASAGPLHWPPSVAIVP